MLDPGTGKNEHFLASFLANGQQLQEYLFRPNFWPDGTPVWFVDNAAAPNCHSLAELEKLPGDSGGTRKKNVFCSPCLPEKA